MSQRDYEPGVAGFGAKCAEDAPKRELQVRGALNTLENRLHETSEKVRRLQDRLNPVLRPLPAVGGQGNAPSNAVIPPKAPMACQVEMLVNVAETAIAGLNEILESLEV